MQPNLYFFYRNVVRLSLGVLIVANLTAPREATAGDEKSLIGLPIYAKTDAAKIKIDQKQIGTAADLTYPCRVRNANDEWLWVWVGGKKAEGWIKRTEVCTAQEAVEFFTESLKAKPKDDFALLQRGRAYEELGEIDKAIEDDTQLIALKPKAYAYNERGLRWFAKQDFVKATEDFTAAIKTDNKFVLAYINRGNAARAQKQIDKSLIDFNDAIRLDPQNALAYYNSANAWQEKGKWDMAIQNYDESLKLDPKSALAYLNRGNVRLEQGELAKAADDFRKSIAFDAKGPEAHNNLAWLLATTTIDKLRDGKKGVEYATEACKLTEWKVAGFVDTLAAAYAEAGDFEHAVEFATKAAEKSPDDEKKDVLARLETYQAKKSFREKPKGK